MDRGIKPVREVTGPVKKLCPRLSMCLKSMENGLAYLGSGVGSYEIEFGSYQRRYVKERVAFRRILSFLAWESG